MDATHVSRVTQRDFPDTGGVPAVAGPLLCPVAFAFDCFAVLVYLRQLLAVLIAGSGIEPCMSAAEGPHMVLFMRRAPQLHL